MAKETGYDKVNSLVDHLFRHETGKMVAVLTRIFGIHNLQLFQLEVVLV
ncbi:hypothetical protein [Niastella sp. OAS944]|nr:hypothetical protein [Chitinophagaceae bacterium OAS944]